MGRNDYHLKNGWVIFRYIMLWVFFGKIVFLEKVKKRLSFNKWLSHFQFCQKRIVSKHTMPKNNTLVATFQRIQHLANVNKWLSFDERFIYFSKETFESNFVRKVLLETSRKLDLFTKSCTENQNPDGGFSHFQFFQSKRVSKYASKWLNHSSNYNGKVRGEICCR